MEKVLEQNLVMDIIALHGRIQKKIGGSLSIHGIGFSEFQVLRQLVNAPNNQMRRVDLAEQVGLTASGVTRLLNPMEKIGLVEKQINPRDARVSLVALSSAGQRIYDEAQISFEASSSSLFDRLGKAKLTTFSKLVEQLI